MASVSGSLGAHYLRAMDPNVFGFAYSLNLLTGGIIGGLTSIWGGALGAAVITGLRELLRELVAAAVGIRDHGRADRARADRVSARRRRLVGRAVRPALRRRAGAARIVGRRPGSRGAAAADAIARARCAVAGGRTAQRAPSAACARSTT